MNAKAKGTRSSMTKIYMRVYGRRLFAAAVLKLIGDMFGFINPLAVGLLTAYVTLIKSASADAAVRIIMCSSHGRHTDIDILINCYLKLFHCSVYLLTFRINRF